MYVCTLSRHQKDKPRRYEVTFPPLPPLRSAFNTYIVISFTYTGVSYLRPPSSTIFFVVSSFRRRQFFFLFSFGQEVKSRETIRCGGLSFFFYLFIFCLSSRCYTVFLLFARRYSFLLYFFLDFLSLFSPTNFRFVFFEKDEERKKKQHLNCTT